MEVNIIFYYLKFFVDKSFGNLRKMKVFKKIFYSAKFHLMYFYKIRQFNRPIDNYANILTLKSIEQPIKIPKLVWIYWEGALPILVEKCIARIKILNPHYKVHVLQPDDISNFCDISFDHLSNITSQQKADLLRFKLIYQYGGIWLDASIILYENLDWIQNLLTEHKTQAFAFYRKKNTTNIKFPVVENWLLASMPKNDFFKSWYDELLEAITLGPKQYVDNIKKTVSHSADIFQQISNLEYLVAYVACQKVMRKELPSITLIDCDQNAFFYQVSNRWVKEKILIDMAINQPALIFPKLIKLAGKERKHLNRYYVKGIYFKNSLLDI